MVPRLPDADQQAASGAQSAAADSIEVAGPKNQGNKRLVMSAVQQGGMSLRYASEKLRADPVVVRAAVKNAH